MRRLPFAALAAALLLPLGATVHAANGIPKTLNIQLPYPAEVSLVQERMGWTFLDSSSNLPLYVHQRPLAGKSDCDRTCEGQWIPLLAPAGEKPLGEWTILLRKDGRRQWAFDQYPVYTHLHDQPGMPSAHDTEGAWRLLHFSS